MKLRVSGDKYVSVENVFDIYNDDQIWYRIKGFRGYEISNKGVIRSLKHFKKYPYGILIQPVNEKKDIFVLSDNNNVRKRLNRNEIYKLRDEQWVSRTDTINGGLYSRTQKHFINYDEVKAEKNNPRVEQLPVLPRDNSYLKQVVDSSFSSLIIEERPIIKPLTFYNTGYC